MKSLIIALWLFIFCGGQVFASVSTEIAKCDLKITAEERNDESTLLTFDYSSVPAGYESTCTSFDIFAKGMKAQLKSQGVGVATQVVNSVASQIVIQILDSNSRNVIQDIYVQQNQIIAIDPTNIY